VAEYRTSTDPDRAAPAPAQVLLAIEQPFATHNGGTLRFGPDHLLYVGMGDGGAANDPGNRAQDPQSLLGKLLRIDVDAAAPYAIPAGNPFARGGGRPEIFARGLRNPWKFAFDRATGDLYIGDVGQDVREEIDYLPAGQGSGANFGWRAMEGTRCTGLAASEPCGGAALTLPVFEYGHDQGCSVTGGYVYRGTDAPSLSGRYVFGDYCSGEVWALGRRADGVWHAERVLEGVGALTTFGEDEQGNLYFADAARGTVQRLRDEGAGTVRVVEYYHAGLDHYFITAFAAEIAALDAGRLAGWSRTGESFLAYAGPQPGIAPACRFYLPPGSGDSHFHSVSADECAEIAAKHPSFVLESDAAFALAPGGVDGICPIGLVPVYRLWNARVDTNHRYTASPAVRDAMVARGYVAEGHGPAAVAMCAPPDGEV
jgi:hypothetical protein